MPHRTTVSFRKLDTLNPCAVMLKSEQNPGPNGLLAMWGYLCQALIICSRSRCVNRLCSYVCSFDLIQLSLSSWRFVHVLWHSHVVGIIFASIGFGHFGMLCADRRCLLSVHFVGKITSSLIAVLTQYAFNTFEHLACAKGGMLSLCHASHKC